MDILGQDINSGKTSQRWFNAASDDIAILDAAISEKIEKIDELNDKIDNAKAKIRQCEAGGLLYNCSKNTGKTLNTWRNYRDNWQGQVRTLTSDLDKLKKQRLDALTALQKASETGTTIAKQESESAEASSKKASFLACFSSSHKKGPFGIL